VLMSHGAPADLLSSPPVQALLCRILYHYTLVTSYDLSTEGAAGAVHAEHLRGSFSWLQSAFSRVYGGGSGQERALAGARRAVEQVLRGKEVTFWMSKGELKLYV
jgi:hypothetical protein